MNKLLMISDDTNSRLMQHQHNQSFAHFSQTKPIQRYASKVVVALFQIVSNIKSPLSIYFIANLLYVSNISCLLQLLLYCQYSYMIVVCFQLISVELTNNDNRTTDMRWL